MKHSILVTQITSTNRESGVDDFSGTLEHKGNIYLFNGILTGFGDKILISKLWLTKEDGTELHFQENGAFAVELTTTIFNNLSSLKAKKTDLLDQHQATIDRLQAEIDRLKLITLPAVLTPVVKSVLGMMCFKTGPFAHAYRSAGFDIPRKAEEEQAFCLHRWLLIALEHGVNWPLIVQQEIKDLATNSKLWAVNIPHEPGSDDVLHAATDKAHAEQIVQRLHGEIDVAYPTVSEAMKSAISVKEWQGTPAEHAADLAEKWWEQTSFKAQETGHD